MYFLGIIIVEQNKQTAHAFLWPLMTAILPIFRINQTNNQPGAKRVEYSTITVSLSVW